MLEGRPTPSRLRQPGATESVPTSRQPALLDEPASYHRQYSLGRSNEMPTESDAIVVQHQQRSDVLDLLTTTERRDLLDTKRVALDAPRPSPSSSRPPPRTRAQYTGASTTAREQQRQQALPNSNSDSDNLLSFRTEQ